MIPVRGENCRSGVSKSFSKHSNGTLFDSAGLGTRKCFHFTRNNWRFYFIRMSTLIVVMLLQTEVLRRAGVVNAQLKLTNKSGSDGLPPACTGHAIFFVCVRLCVSSNRALRPDEAAFHEFERTD